MNYVTVKKYTCTSQISYKSEIFKSFNSLHFYLDLLLIKCASFVEFISCFCFSAWSKQVCYELIVEFSVKSMSTIIALIVSIKIEELTRKKLLVLKQLMMNI